MRSTPPRTVPFAIIAAAVFLANLTLVTGRAEPNPDGDRASVLKLFDRDGDGRLNDNERERLRKKRFEERRGALNSGRRRMAFPFPPEIVSKYDKDGDGQLNEDESQAARAGIQKIFQDLHAKYDSNRNGRLEPEEMDQIQADKAAGKLDEVPQMFLQMGRRRGPSSASRISTQELAKRMDRNQDGRLSSGELEAARSELEKLQNVSPKAALKPR